TVTAILVVNNLRDIATDRQAGKRTLGVVMGDAGTRRWFLFLLAAAWLAMGAATFAGVEFALAAVVASAALAVRLARPIREGVSGRALNPVLKATARYHLLSGLAWAAAIALSR
ncbi:MAG TPA: UbiA family prenyltransferase, partial [Tepidiformaceae bacterium]|nr:UbiA family prenyltransferase [Tepidiformaceae bacterium]